MYMEKSHASDWLKTVAFFMKHECKVVTRVQVTNSARTLSKFRLSRDKISFVSSFCDIFHVHYLQVIIWFILKSSVINTREQALAIRIYLCLLTSNCTRSHVVTYTYFSPQIMLAAPRYNSCILYPVQKAYRHVMLLLLLSDWFRFACLLPCFWNLCCSCSLWLCFFCLFLFLFV